MQNITGLFFLVVPMNCCKKNSEKKSIDTQTFEQKSAQNSKDQTPTHSSLTLRMLIQKDDDLQLLYVQANTESNSVDRMLSQEVVGSNQIQDINFDVPAEFYPFNFRLDLGTNRLQNSIKIEECILLHGSSEYVLRGSEMSDYFIFNEGVEVLSDSTTFRLKSFKEGKKDKYNPFWTGESEAYRCIIKETITKC